MARSALFVSSSTYADEQLTGLPSTASDAAELGLIVGDPQIGGFSVSTLSDPGAQQMRESLEDFLVDAEPEDLLIVYLSGHGLKDPRGSLYFAAHDTRANRLQPTAVSAYFLCSLLNASRAGGVVVFLDCCYGGAFARGMVPRADGDPHVGDAFGTLGQGARARAVVTASSAIEYAFESERLAASHAEPSVFASAMRDGILRGDADRDGDGWVGLNELFDYVTHRISQLGKPQTPHLWTFGLSGDLRLTRSPRGPRATASALPQEIRELLVSPLPAVRLGAVSDLAERAAGPDLDVARAAVVALAELAEDDSLRVRAAVQNALAATTPVVELAEIAIRPPSSGVATVSARLVGPPIACDAFVESGAAGVSADVVGAEIKIRVSASAVPGEQTLNLRWAGGVVPIELTIEPTEPAAPQVVTPGSAGEQTADLAGVADRAPQAVGGSATQDDSSDGRGRPGVRAEADRGNGQAFASPDDPVWIVTAGGLWVLVGLLPYGDAPSLLTDEYIDAVTKLLFVAIGLISAAVGVYRMVRHRSRPSLVVAVIMAIVILGLSVTGVISAAIDDATAVLLFALVTAAFATTYLITMTRRGLKAKRGLLE